MLGKLSRAVVSPWRQERLLSTFPAGLQHGSQGKLSTANVLDLLQLHPAQTSPSAPPLPCEEAGELPPH